MSKTTGVGALLTGMAIGAAALFLSDEKNRAKVKASIIQLTGDANKVLTDVKKKAAATGKQISAVSKDKMVDVLDETGKVVKSASKNLAASNTTAKK